MASITTKAELDKVRSMLGKQNNSYFWVGAAGKWRWTRRKGEYIWVHSSGLQVRECGAYSQKKFVRGRCSRKLPYICMRDNDRDDTFEDDNPSSFEERQMEN